MLTPDSAPRRAALLFVVLSAAVSTGCTTGWARRGVELPLDVSGNFVADPDPQDPTLEPAAEAIDHWWQAFDEPSLDEAIERTISGSLTLSAAALRVRQAAAVARIADSSRYPTLDASASAGRSRSNAPPPVGPGQSNQFNVSVSAGYEVDVWGRLAAGRDAAELDVIGLGLDARAIEVTLAASAAEAWIDGVYARARRALIARQIGTQEDFLELILLRLTTANATALDIEQQRQQIQALRGQTTLLAASEETAGHRLAVLQGRMPDPSATGSVATLPAMPPMPELGVPADLLSRRPDVAAARIRAEAADARLAQAVADRLPTLRLSGSVFLQSTSLSSLFDQLLWNVVAGVAAPLVDGGRRAAEMRRSEAVLDERIVAYADALLSAALEVKNALALERAQHAYIYELGLRAETARRAIGLVREQYREGVVDYLRVLSNLTALQQVEQAQLDAERQLITYRIQLYRALGGGWSAQEAAE